MKKILKVMMFLVIMLIILMVMSITSNAVSIKSREYTIEEDIISRVMPKTSIDVFKSNITASNRNSSISNITIKKNTEEITTGNISTGMSAVISVSSGNGILADTYVLSVSGDVTGDGETNAVDLTRIIRYIIGKTDVITGEEYLKAANVNNNEKIDVGDLTRIIKYIVTTKEEYLKDSNKTETYEEYLIGDIVIVGEEEFYVLEDSDETQENVTLLSRDVLNKEGTEQVVNEKHDDTGVAFSSDIYWRSVFESYTDWENKKLDLNTLNIEVQGDAIYKARAYAIEKGGSNGRLLTLEEVNALKDDYPTMIWGDPNMRGEYNVLYWLSSVERNYVEYLYYVHGGVHSCGVTEYNYDEANGVRPVMTMDKSKVTKIGKVRNIRTSDYGRYVDIGTNILDKTIELADGTTPKSDWRIFKKSDNGVWLMLADYMPNSAFDVTSVGLAVKADSSSKYGVRTETNRVDLYNGLNNRGWNNLINGSRIFGKNGVQVKGAIDIDDWVASWNANPDYTTLYTARTDSIMSDGLYGVYIGKEENPTTYYSTAKEPYGVEIDTLYYPHKEYCSDVLEYWLLSPSSRDKAMMSVQGHQNVIWDNPFGISNVGVRPVVFVPNTLILDKSEEVWKIN